MKHILFYSSLLLLASCVSSKQFNETEKQRITCQDELKQLKAKSVDAESKTRELENKIGSLTVTTSALKKDSAAKTNKIKGLEDDFKKVKADYETITSKNKDLLNGNDSENKKLMSNYQQSQEELQKREDELKQKEKKLASEQQKLTVAEKKLNETQATLKTREARIEELEAILKQKDNAVNEIKRKVQAALVGFEGKGLTISQKNGKIYVSLDESLLFASGSTAVETKGVDALKKLAKVLEQNNDINVMVEGHTDDVPMNGKGDIKDNWDLSVMRATSIVKIITTNSNTSPVRLIAAGRGEFLPLDKDKTADARRKNRRTEIILTPKLDELLKILEN
ncbi:MAG: OmpA family protein [Bacteroidia bacterium]|nr:OmpA family protein [Bacteroidia bacterium]